jgi:integrase
VVGGVIDRANALRKFKTAADAADVSWANWQALRRTFLTACARAGMPTFALKEIAGHSSVRTTETYYIGAAGAANMVPPVLGA